MSIPEIQPRQALDRQRRSAVLIDVREAHERALGMAEGARGIAMGELIAAAAEHLPDTTVEVLLICQSGMRSLRTAEALMAQGYANVASVAGGTARWAAESLPMMNPVGSIDADFAERYSRHLRLPQVGLEGQRKLESARVLLVGAGGLGSPAAFYLAAAGVGHLRLVDDDVVDRSNLQRQILHVEAAIGQAKVESARERLAALNPRVVVEGIRERATSANVEALLEGMDVVVDGSDNFPVRYLLNDACVKLGKPLVYGAVQRFEGQASVFDAGRHRGRCPCYRCLFPEPPPPQFAPSCADAGVLGVLPGIVGLLQFDALAMRFREVRLAPDPQCPVCAPGRPFPGYIDYARFCTTGG